MSFRIGTGFDVHRLVEGRPLILGGITVPSSLGLLGHSDADVLTHAICDALLGAAGLLDIGHYFPDNDQKFKDADSMALLAQVLKLIAERGYSIVNIDSTLILEKPKVAAYIPAMINRLSEVLQVTEAQVSVKATTSEGLGYTGRGEGAAAQAVVLIAS